MLRQCCPYQCFQHFAGLRLWQAPCTQPTRQGPDMFKISIVDTRSQRKLVVEGKLTEPWVPELVAAWRNAARDFDGRKLVIDLNSLTVISREGEDAIFDLMRQGVKFSCGSIFTRYLLKRLARECHCDLAQAIPDKRNETHTSLAE